MKWHQTLYLIFGFFCRGPKLPTPVKILIFKTVRSRENQAVLQDNKTTNNIVRGRLWDSMTDKINRVCVYFSFLKNLLIFRSVAKWRFMHVFLILCCSLAQSFLSSVIINFRYCFVSCIIFRFVGLSWQKNNSRAPTREHVTRYIF